MCNKRVLGRKLLPCSVALLILVSPLLAIAQERAAFAGPGDPAAPIDSHEGAAGGSPGQPEAVPIGPEAPGFHTANLRVDGNIAGRTRIIDASGNLAPIRAKVTFMQYERVVTEVRSDELGHFQVVDMQPGVYAVVAIAGASRGSSSYLAAFGMRVLPYAENAPGSQRLLDIVLLPLNGPLSFLGEDGRDLYRLLPQQPVMMGGGGGGGLGSLLGLAGLAGLAGLGGDGGGQQSQKASPHAP